MASLALSCFLLSRWWKRFSELLQKPKLQEDTVKTLHYEKKHAFKTLPNITKITEGLQRQNAAIFLWHCHDLFSASKYEESYRCTFWLQTNWNNFETLWLLLLESTESKTCVCMTKWPARSQVCMHHCTYLCECYQENLWLNSQWIAQILTETAGGYTSACVCVKDLANISHQSCLLDRLVAFSVSIFITVWLLWSTNDWNEQNEYVSWCSRRSRLQYCSCRLSAYQTSSLPCSLHAWGSKPVCPSTILSLLIVHSV